MAEGKKEGVVDQNSGKIARSNNPSLQISPLKQDRTNYLIWCRSCLLFIQARGLQGYIIGTKVRTALEDPNFSRWESENSLIMSLAD